ncbi:NAD-dependent succinate-semialdehyde dehydrogenase [Endozoicomonas sp. G2_2]|uniref:NAD-dependent succinate-semialdehyde dehydrogenase n=2 Tax=Gammaproteobacteria TaxID=1236 RepID=UPI001ADA0D43|nr:NAD-dependent succinate-semialdehyde dehydrogenase [Endozoicomonas sp. G2_2]MBO9469774.1 NAD-dependent succinate-semialdehyde dehydrogenase [Endozoicomonas sp. G2_2]
MTGNPPTYPDVSLLINGEWKAAQGGDTLPVINPATGETIGQHAHARQADLDAALEAADAGFKQWRSVPAVKRAAILNKASALLRERADDIARLMVLEQGKPLAEARGETLGAAGTLDWFAEEGKRVYGRVIPARADNVQQIASKHPVGPVAAFTPWNFPLNQAVRKVSIALAAGCSIILKGPEETPASVAELIRCYVDAGVPAGVVNLVYGVPAEISEYLIPHPVIRKISFTGSTAVGKQLAALAGAHMKRNTMELGGHAPTMIFDDADMKSAVKMASIGKFMNAGQVCIAPTRFLVQEGVYEEFVDQFVKAAGSIKVGNGLEEDTRMGPLVHDRRPGAVGDMVDDAKKQGADVRLGGKTADGPGYFFEPTVLTNLTPEMKIMNEEPFGPVAVFNTFKDTDEAIAEANRLPYGLAAYAFTSSMKTAHRLGQEIEAGMISINHLGLALPETPFGGVKDSGYGSEGGSEAIESYLETRFVTTAAV